MEPEEAISGGELEQIAKRTIKRFMPHAPADVIREEATSLAYGMAELAQTRLYELAATFPPDERPEGVV